MAKKQRKHAGGSHPADAEGPRVRHHPPLGPSGMDGAGGMIGDLPAGPGAPVAGWMQRLITNTRAFSGVDDAATLLWPRWLVLRAVGLVFLFVFAGIVVEAQALVGPKGITPVALYLAELEKAMEGSLRAWFSAPSLFWLGSGAGMVTTLAWTGCAAAAALVFNLWPRMALGVCWLVFLSFVTTWGEFSPAQLDRLMLEVALLCIPFAPPGFRPGLGASHPPRTLVVFMMRWLLLRVMLEPGLVKFTGADPHWRNFTAMEVMYETSPAPTVLGYWAHHLPHALHLGQIALTFVAEIMAPVIAVFGGRRGRWFAFIAWALLQGGIQLTCNFGWLNTAALGLGLLLLDDRMLATAASKVRLGALGRRLAAACTPVGPRPANPWVSSTLRVALGAHFCVTLFYFARACGVPVDTAPRVIAAPINFLAEFRSANGYFLYARFEPTRFQIEFEGSNDAGRTWRSFKFRHLPQHEGEISGFIAPWFPRFETTIQLHSTPEKQSTVLPLIAAHLLARNPEVMRRFANNPFPDRPPTLVRLRRYRLAFTSPATKRETGHYWRKEYAGDYQPAFYLTKQGAIAQFDLGRATAAVKAGDHVTAFGIYMEQYALGNLEAGARLADMYAQGMGVTEQPEKAFALLSDLAARGEVSAQHNLGVCYEYGVGVTADPMKAAACYRSAAERGHLISLFALGTLSAKDLISPRDDIQGLASLLRAGARAVKGAPWAERIRAEQPGHVAQLMARMSAENIAEAKRRAAEQR